MYPRHYFDLFRPNVDEKRVFVGMSFAPEDVVRWDTIICPAIAECGFEPYRVDMDIVGDSILIAIMDGILSSKLLVFDVSAKESGERSGNVMYELGLAHAIRHPEEILILRSDSQRLLFDISNIRVHKYELDDPGRARSQVAEILKSLDAGLHSLQGLVLKKTIDLLDDVCLGIMSANAETDVFSLQVKSKEQAFEPEISVQRAAIRHLLDMNVLSFIWRKEERLYAFAWTYFGKVLLRYLGLTAS